MRRNKILLAAAACVAAVGCALTIWTAGIERGRKPFEELEPTEIAMATVTLTPPDLTVEVSDLEELTTLLQAVELYKRDDSYTEYAGQGVTFTLHMADGSRVDAMAYNPFFIINGEGYRTEYAPCEALNHYANELLARGDAEFYLESPPSLAVVSDQTSTGGFLGSYSWEYPQGDGSITSAQADSMHPLEAREYLEGLDTRKATASLKFAVEPQEVVEVRCWSDACWSDTGAESELAVLQGDTLELNPGGWIYEVQARWDLQSGCGGTALYSFYIIRE